MACCVGEDKTVEEGMKDSRGLIEGSKMNQPSLRWAFYPFSRASLLVWCTVITYSLPIQSTITQKPLNSNPQINDPNDWVCDSKFIHEKKKQNHNKLILAMQCDQFKWSGNLAWKNQLILRVFDVVLSNVLWWLMRWIWNGASRMLIIALWLCNTAIIQTLCAKFAGSVILSMQIHADLKVNWLWYIT